MEEKIRNITAVVPFRLKQIAGGQTLTLVKKGRSTQSFHEFTENKPEL